MSIKEASWRMRSSPSEDIERFQNGRAMSERIHEWLATPEGTVANDPSWGNNLWNFKHEPISSNLEVQIEMHIAKKLMDDIEDLVITGISVEAKDIDLLLVTVSHQYGTENTSIQL